MQEFRHVLETRGRYQLVAVSHEPVYAPGDVVGHAVVADDGDRLTDLVSLAEARQLLLQRVREEGEEPGLENENHLRKRRRAGAAARPSRPRAHHGGFGCCPVRSICSSPSSRWRPCCLVSCFPAT